MEGADRRANERANPGCIPAPEIALKIEERMPGDVTDSGKAPPLMSQEPMNANAWLQRACEEEEQDRTHAALTAVDEALSLSPILAEAWRLKASLLLDMDRTQEALQTLEQATSTLPQDPGCWFERGAALVEEDPATAADCFTRVQQLAPDFPRVTANLGIALLKAGRFEEAVRALEAAVTRSPEEAHLWSHLGEAALAVHRCRQALDSFDRALALTPDDYVILGNRALALCHLSRPEPALACLERALELAPQEARLWAIRGLLMEQAMHPDEALAAFDRSLDLDPRDPDTWSHKAQHLLGRGRTEEAVRCRRQALMLSGRLKVWGLCLLDEANSPVPGTELRCETDLPPEAIAHRYLADLAGQGHQVDQDGLVDGRFRAALWEMSPEELPT